MSSSLQPEENGARDARNYYLILFMFVSQLYFYVLVLLVYWAISILI